MNETIRATCPNCQATYNLPTATVGKIAKCKRCDAKFTVAVDTRPASRAATLPEPESPPAGVVVPREAVVVAAVPEPAASHLDLHDRTPRRAARGPIEVEHRQAGRFGNGFLTAMGCFAAAALVAALSVLFVCGGGLALVGVGTAGASKAANEAAAKQKAANDAAIAAADPTAPAPSAVAGVTKTAPTAPAAVVDWKLPVTSDRVAVSITGLTIGEVDIVNDATDRKAVSENARIAVSVTVTNTSSDKKLDYKSWARSGSFLESGHATLKDEHGNQYKWISFGFSKRAAGGANAIESLYPGKQVKDVLVFETPVDTAKLLILTLPGANFGGTGDVVFRIPVEAVIKR